MCCRTLHWLQGPVPFRQGPCLLGVLEIHHVFAKHLRTCPAAPQIRRCGPFLRHMCSQESWSGGSRHAHGLSCSGSLRTCLGPSGQRTKKKTLRTHIRALLLKLCFVWICALAGSVNKNEDTSIELRPHNSKRLACWVTPNTIMRLPSNLENFLAVPQIRRWGPLLWHM